MAEPIPSKKGRTRKPLKPKNPSANDTNIVAGKPTQEPFLSADANKENAPNLPSRKPKSYSKQEPSATELQDIKGKLEQLKLEKEQTEELLKQRDELLKQKQEELEIRVKAQEKLESELKKLQRLKEFKPTMAMPAVQSLRAKEHEKKEKSKKPRPSYILWCKDQWNQVKKDNPEAEFKQIGNILGAKWKTLSVEEKKPYEEKYQSDKQSYLQMVGKEKREKEALMLLEEDQKQKMALELLEQYLDFKQVADNENKKKKKKEKDPLKPKQPLSAFFLFSNERRKALLIENHNILEVAKATGEEWKNMTEEQRAPYQEIAKKQKELYMQELEIYKQIKEEEAAIIQRGEKEQIQVRKQEALQLLRKKEKTQNIIKKSKETQQKKKKEREPNKPKKPATSFFLFSKETRKLLLEERPGISNSTLNAMISVRWKELNEEEKQVWNAKAAEGMEVYKKAMEEYNRARVVEITQQP